MDIRKVKKLILSNYCKKQASGKSKSHKAQMAPKKCVLVAAAHWMQDIFIQRLQPPLLTTHAAQSQAAPVSAPAAVLPPQGHAVKSPMVGTAYLAPAPG